jgi:hypothetical protein
VSEIFNCEIN